MKILQKITAGVAAIAIVVATAVSPVSATAGETVVSGFNFSESVIHDPFTDRYLVSNMGNAPGAPAAPGYISTVNPNGQVINYKWIDGANAATSLNDPAGMAVYAGKLYVADGQDVEIFNVFNGQHIASVNIPGTTSLNDVTPYWGGVVVSDPGFNFNTNTPTGTDALYKINGFTNQVTTLASGTQLANPNGLLFVPGQGLLVAPMTSPTVRLVNVWNGQVSNFATLPDVGYDGIALAGGSFYFNNPLTGNVFKTDLSGGNVTLLANYPAFPADMNADIFRNRLLIPQLFGGSIIIKQL